MEAFTDWVSSHVLTSMLIVGSVVAVVFVFANRKALFYKQ